MGLVIETLDFEGFAVLQVAVHNFENRFRKSHTEQGVRDFGVSVDLPQFEETLRDLCRVLYAIEYTA